MGFVLRAGLTEPYSKGHQPHFLPNPHSDQSGALLPPLDPERGYPYLDVDSPISSPARSDKSLQHSPAHRT